MESSGIRSYFERVGQWWRLAKGSHVVVCYAGAALDAVARAVTLLSPMPPDDSDRQLTQLELACIRSGRTLDQVAFLARIPASRLQAIIAGAPMSTEERQAPVRILPDWKPW